MSIHRYGSIVLLGILVMSQAAMAAADPKQSFETLYGGDAKKVTTKDAAAFAERLTNDAGNLKDDQALAALLLDKAREFLSRSPAGDERTRVGEVLIDRFVELGEARVKDEAPGEAIKAFQQAYQVASLVRSPKLKDIAARNKRIQDRLDVDKKIADYQARVKADPTDAATAKLLVHLLVVEMDRPAAARPYLQACQDSWLQSHVPLADGNIADVPVGECKAMAEWYRGQATRASAAGKAAALCRAKAYYERFVASYDKQDVSFLAAKKAITDVQKELDGMTAATAPSDAAAKATPAATDLGDTIWKLQSGTGGSRSNSHTFWELRKDGGIVETHLGDYSSESGRRDIYARTSDGNKRWEVKDKALIVTVIPHQNANWSETYTFAYPLQETATPGERVYKSADSTSTTKMVIARFRGSLPAEVAKHIGSSGQKTKFPGLWGEQRGSSSYSTTWEFFDDGVMVRINRYTNTYPGNYRPPSSGTHAQAGKWEVKGKELVIALMGEDITLPLPLNKDGAQGRRSRRNSGSGDTTTYSTEITLKLVQP